MSKRLQTLEIFTCLSKVTTDGRPSTKFCGRSQQKRVSTLWHFDYMDVMGPLCKLCTSDNLKFRHIISFRYRMLMLLWLYACGEKIKSWSIGYFSMLSNNAVIDSAEYTWIFQNIVLWDIAIEKGKVHCLYLPINVAEATNPQELHAWWLISCLGSMTTRTLIPYSRWVGLLPPPSDKLLLARNPGSLLFD